MPSADQFAGLLKHPHSLPFLLILLIFIAAPAKGVAAPPLQQSKPAHNQEAIEAQFLIGLSLLDSGQYEAAIRVFSDLSTKTSSARVDLELARSLYLSGYYQAALDVFEKTEAQHALPLAVKRTVYNYLDEIDLELGFLRIDLALVSDSNPANFTSSKEVTIGGQKLQVVAPESNKERRGLQYQVYGAKALLGRTVIGRFNFSHSDLPERDYDRSSLDLGLNIKLAKFNRFRISPGYTRYLQAGKKIHEHYYAGLKYYPDRVREFQQNYQLILGRMIVANAPQYDATKLTLNSSFQMPLNPSYTATYGLTIDSNKAREKPYSYNKAGLNLGLEFPITSLRVNLNALLGKKVYRQDDPLFGARRKDENKSLSLTFRPTNLKLFSRYVEIGVSYERVDSTLNFFSYDKTSLVFKLTERR